MTEHDAAAGRPLEDSREPQTTEAVAPVTVLEAIPSLGSAYRSALVKTARAAVRKSSSQSLPSKTLAVRGVELDREADRRVRVAAGGRAGEFASAEYLHTLAFPLAMELLVDPEFPLPIMGMVHLSNRVDYLTAADFSQPVDVTAFARSLSGHSAGTTVELVVEVSRNGRVLFRDAGVNLARGVFLAGKPEKTATEQKTFEGRTAQWRLPAETGRDWARVSGDYNPIHLSAASARLLGMKSAIAHGMYLASRALELALPAGVVDGYRWDVRFLTPVNLPATVDVRVDVERVEEAGGGEVPASVQFQGWSGRTGKPHFLGEISFTRASGHSA